MGKNQANFVKGHMGGNAIVLIYGEGVRSRISKEKGLSLLYPPQIGGDQVGLLEASGAEGSFKVDILDINRRGYLEMCGGLTQVLGKALVETDLGTFFDVDQSRSSLSVELVTEMGIVPIKIQKEKSRFLSARARMDQFVSGCQQRGIEELQLGEFSVVRVADFLVVAVPDLKAEYPRLRFDPLNDKAREVLQKVQSRFSGRYSDGPNADFAVYDPSSSCSDGKVIFPHRLDKGYVEPACGTGTVAIGLAMIERGEIEPEEDCCFLQVSFESGGSPHKIGGPDRSYLEVEFNHRSVVGAQFSHSSIHIVATGRVWL